MATISQLALDSLNRVYADKFSDVIFRSPLRPLIALFDNDGQLHGGDTYNFGIRVTGNSGAETYSEGAATPNPGNSVVVQATVPYTAVRAVASITGHAEYAAKGSPNEDFFIQGELDDALRALEQKCVSTIVGTSAVGLQALVDSASTFHGLSRTTYPNLASVENSTFSAVMEELRAHGARTSVILMSPESIGDYIALAPQSASGVTTPINVSRWDISGDKSIDLGANWNGVRYCGIPIVECIDLTDDVALFLDLTPGNIQFVEHRPFEIKLIENGASDAKVFELYYSFGLAMKKPNLQGKATSIAL